MAMTSPAPIDTQALADHVEWVRRLAYALVHDVHRADDLAQRTLVAALEHPPEDRGRLRAWLASVLRNVARREARDAGTRVLYESRSRTPEPAPSPEQILTRATAHRDVVNAVLALEEPYRTTILLRFFEGLTAAQAAARLEIPAATVHTRTQRALERLRAKLDAHHGSREAWAALLWLAKPGSVPMTLGALLMNTKILVGAAVLLLAAVAAFVFRPGASSDGALVAASPGGSPLRAEAAAQAPSVASTETAKSDRSAASSPARAESRGAGPAKDPKLATPSVIIRGRVIDVESRAVAGIAVRARKGSLQASVATDADGRFELETNDSSALIEAVSERYITVLAGELTAARSSAEPVLVVAPRVTVAGSVASESGSAVEGARVLWTLPDDFRGRFREILDFSREDTWLALSDSRGAFSLGAVPAVRGAELAVSREGYQSVSLQAPEVSTWTLPVILKSAAAAEGSWSGRVVDDGGAAVARAVVSTGREGAVFCDDEGRFHVSARLRDRITFTALMPNYLPAILEADGTKPRTDITLRLNAGARSVSGRVLDSSGKPLGGATVWLADPTWFGHIEQDPVSVESILGDQGLPVVTADANGEFTLRGLSAREYTIVGMHPRTLAVVQKVGVAAGSTGVTLTVSDADVHAEVAGVVVDRQGNPVPDVEVGTARRGCSLAIPPNGRWVNNPTGVRVSTDAEGRFRIRELARDGTFLTFDASTICPDSLFAPFADAGAIRMQVLRRCHLKVEIPSDLEADQFEVLDEKGAKMEINIWKGENVIGSLTGEITKGASPMVAVSEAASTLILRNRGKEVRRMPLSLTPGAPTIARPQ